MENYVPLRQLADRELEFLSSFLAKKFYVLRVRDSNPDTILQRDVSYH